MQAIILATHEVRTLLPLTDTMPGALLPIVDRPVMAMTVEILARIGQKRILVSLYNQGGSIASYFGSGKRWGVDLEYVAQRESWGSAGSLRWVAGLLDETFLVLPGDQVVDVDVEAALAFHRAHGGLATVIMHPALPGAHVPHLALTPDNQVGAHGTPYAVTGAFIFEPQVLQQIAPRTQADILADLLPALATCNHPVYGFVMQGYWNPLDSLAAFHAAQQVVLYSAVQEKAPDLALGGPSERVRYPALSSRHIVPGVWVGPNHSIHPSVKIAAPVYIGDNCYIGREVEIGAGTVIGSNVVIDDEATVSGSTILRETYVGQLVKVEGRIVTPATISDPESGETTQVVDPFLLSRVGTRHEGPNRLALNLTRGVAGALLVVLGPLFLILFFLTTIVTLGRPIVRHMRVGQRITNPDGSPGLYEFSLLNFRTRRRNGRYTLLGGWMERWELQRLPELINVLRGDLALVGVKPLTPDQAKLLTEEWHQKRHDTQAGITGLWYQQTDPSSDLDTIIIADVYYTATRTWHSDVLLFLRTPAIWVRRNIHRHTSKAMIHADHGRSMEPLS
ncbi:sugar phosphate nucleotidyltransferase [Candidatus Oscillochloris fontis]|uniref:sugar phosphate nucleotidyltransferase n=1 Tax=Candidatus Oscillochloris fontis TaxID=2496868 RepID=UPI00101BB1AF|nr:sugar phosphate nucleotidyltransferase [Candidatus Oscillochloris fontis]